MMWSNTKRAVLAVAVFALLSFGSPGKSFANEQNWEYVQSIGGMKLGAPSKTDIEWVLPVEIDVSGKREITVPPTTQSDSRSCIGVGAEFHGNDIYLALFTGFTTLGGQITGCPPISLGHPEPGSYAVYYKGLSDEPVKLTDITIEP